MYIKITIPMLFVLLSACTFAQNDSAPAQEATFQLKYSYSGLGSNFGTKQPVFRINGNAFVYTLEQNTYFGEKPCKPDTLCSGKIRQTSIDSIIQLVAPIKDTLIYRNGYFMSGGIHHLSIAYETINLAFKLHNSSDPIAEQIIAILNSNLPPDVSQLWLFNLPEEE